MREAEARIVRANLDALARGRVLTIGFGPPVPAMFDDVTSFTTDLRTHRAVDGSTFAPWFDGGGFDAALVLLPKERERLAMWLAMARSAIGSGGTVALAGHNRAGARGSERLFRERIGAPALVDARAHCRLYLAEDVRPTPASLAEWRVEFPAGEFTVVSYPGVFSHGRLDAGTALLLEHVPDPAGARVLDVGCGSGVIAAHLAARGASVTAVDADALALRATTETLEANGLTGTVLASDVYSDVDKPFDLIVSNPPFHAGVRTTHAVTREMIARAPAYLGGSGELWVVGNRFIDHRRAFGDVFGSVDIVADDGRFKVWRAR